MKCLRAKIDERGERVVHPMGESVNFAGRIKEAEFRPNQEVVVYSVDDMLIAPGEMTRQAYKGGFDVGYKAGFAEGQKTRHDEERLYPVLDPPPGAPVSVPWSFLEPYEANAKKNHDQSLAELAKRGGLSVSEIVAVVEGTRSRFDKPEDIKRLISLVDEWRIRKSAALEGARAVGVKAAVMRMREIIRTAADQLPFSETQLRLLMIAADTVEGDPDAWKKFV